MKQVADTWRSADPYEYFMGRWSRQIAPLFLEWLQVPLHKRWLEIGCGTGALSETLYNQCAPHRLMCIDPSAGFLEKAKGRLPGGAEFKVGDAAHIPEPDAAYDLVVSGLALNFFPDLPAALAEMKRVLRPGGTVAAYVWDYAGRMEFLRYFWDAARAVDANAGRLDEGFRFPICQPGSLWHAFEQAGFIAIETSYLDTYTVFSNFDDYWDPFLGGQGPAPTYVASLPATLQHQLKELLRNLLPVETDGSIKLLARAIAVKGVYKPTA